MSKYTQEQVDAVHKLPLRQDVPWIDMSFMFPGKIFEEVKREPGDEAAGKWACVDMEHAECAAQIVECHNEWLKANAPARVWSDDRGSKHVWVSVAGRLYTSNTLRPDVFPWTALDEHDDNVAALEASPMIRELTPDDDEYERVVTGWRGFKATIDDTPTTKGNDGSSTA